MGISQPQPTALRVTIRNKDRHIHNPRDQHRIFGAAESHLSTALQVKGYSGEFLLSAVKVLKGCSARQGIKFLALDEDQNRIAVSIQPGSNDTAWQYWLTAPQGTDLADLYYAFTASSPGKKKETGSPAPVDAQQGVEEEPQAPAVAVLEPVAPPPVMGPVEFAADLSMVALAIGSCFRRYDSRPTPDDVIITLQEEMQWTEAQARQGYLCLVNRSHLKLQGTKPAERVLVGSDQLRAAFREIGIVQEVRPEYAACVPSVPLPPVRAVRPPVPTLRDSRVEKPRVEVKSVNLTDTFDELGRKASTFESARRSLLQGFKARSALTHRCERARQEMDAAQAALSHLEGELATHLEIVSDPTYSEAANKLSQIKAIIGG